MAYKSEKWPIFVGEFNSTVSSFLLFNSLKLESLRPLNTPLLNGQELIWGSSHLIFTFSAGLQSSFVENLKKVFSLHFLILPKNEFSLFIFSHQIHHNLLCSCFISALVLVVEIGKLNDQCEACHVIPKERQAQAPGGQLSAKHTPCSSLSWFITLFRANIEFPKYFPYNRPDFRGRQFQIMWNGVLIKTPNNIQVYSVMPITWLLEHCYFLMCTMYVFLRADPSDANLLQARFAGMTEDVPYIKNNYWFYLAYKSEKWPNICWRV